MRPMKYLKTLQYDNNERAIVRCSDQAVAENSGLKEVSVTRHFVIFPGAIN